MFQLYMTCKASTWTGRCWQVGPGSTALSMTAVLKRFKSYFNGDGVQLGIFLDSLEICAKATNASQDIMLAVFHL